MVSHNKNHSKKYFIRTFGCQMNDYDSVLMAEGLEEYGYLSTDEVHQADLILFNTCAVRGLAEHKAISELGATKKLKLNKPNLKVGIVGCVAQKLGKEILKKYPFVDFVLGTKEMYRLAEFLDVQDDKPLIKTELDFDVAGYKTKSVKSVSSYVTVVRGCTNFCTYCIVPYVRGKEESRTTEEIEDEVKSLVSNGVCEVILLGQNVNIYGQDIGTNLETLLLKLSNIKDLKRIRYVTSHPMSVNQEFIDVVKNIPKVSKHIHIPFQSGSNKILKEMNRKYTREEYIKKVAALKQSIFDICITADIIVGFSGETESDFLDTLSMVEICRFDNVYSFKYSPREGTAAYKNMKDDVPKKEKEARLARLHEVSHKISLEINQQFIGTTQAVLWEGVKVYKGNKLLEGRTDGFKKIFAPFRDGRVGQIDRVKVLKAMINSLSGEIVG